MVMVALAALSLARHSRLDCVLISLFVAADLEIKHVAPLVHNTIGVPVSCLYLF